MPLTRCSIDGQRGWKWGEAGKCYPGASGRARALRQAAAIRASGYTGNQRRAPNPLRADPTRTATLRRQFVQELNKRFLRIKSAIVRLIIDEDAFGLRRDNQSHTTGGLLRGQSTVDSTLGAAGDIGGPAGGSSPGINRRGDATGRAHGPTAQEGGPYAGPGGSAGAEAPSAGGPTVNTRWRFLTTPEKVTAFNEWLRSQVEAEVIAGATAEQIERAYWTRYVEEGYRKGAGRAFDDVRPAATAGNLDFYQGTRQQFLRDAFAHPVSVDKVKLLAGRVLTDLKGVNEAMAADMSRVLTDGLVRGDSPLTVARALNKRVDAIGRTRARTIARTETIRAHAEGQLDALEQLGVEKVGVMVEWSTTGDDLVCPLCAPMEGVVMKIGEARGSIPRHPNCRCAYIPANVGEDKRGQKRSAARLEEARDESIRQEIPKRLRGTRSLEEQRARSRWAGADTGFSGKRPRSVLEAPRTPSKRPPEPRVPKPRKGPPAPSPKPSGTARELRIRQLEELRRQKPLGGADSRELAKLQYQLSRKTPGVVTRVSELEEEILSLRHQVFGSPPAVTGIDSWRIINERIPQLQKELTEARLIHNQLANNPELNRLTKAVADLNLESKPSPALVKARKAMNDAETEMNSIWAERDWKALEWADRQYQATGNKTPSAEFWMSPEGQAESKRLTAATEKFDALNSKVLNLETKAKEAPNKRAWKLLEVAEDERLGIGTKLSKETWLADADDAASLTNPTYSKEFKQKLNDAKSWLSRLTRRQVADRGELVSAVDEIEVYAHRIKGRAFHRAVAKEHGFGPNRAGVFLDESDTASTFIHELAHRLEVDLPQGLDSTLEFKTYRINKSGKPVVSLKDKFGGGYKDYERGSDDDWGKLYPPNRQSSAHYVGKDYGTRATEVLSMGVELLFNNPIKFARTDPEYFKLVVGVLRGWIE